MFRRRFDSRDFEFNVAEIRKSEYDKNEDLNLRTEKNVCDLVRYTSENPTPWNWGFNYDYDPDSFDIAMDKGYLDRIMPEEFSKYFEKYSKEELIIQSQSVIDPETSKEDVIKILMDEADYSWIVSEKGYEYLKSNPLYVFFTDHLIKFNMYEFKFFAEKNSELEIEEIADKYINLKLKNALRKGDNDCYLYYIDYQYTLSLKKEDYDSALYYLCQRIIFQTNAWLLKKHHSFLDEAYDNETFYLSFRLTSMNLDFDIKSIYDKAFDEFKIDKYRINQEKIYGIMTRLVRDNEDPFYISADLIEDRPNIN